MPNLPPLTTPITLPGMPPLIVSCTLPTSALQGVVASPSLAPPPQIDTSFQDGNVNPYRAVTNQQQHSGAVGL
jgi:hypothetical protein